MRFNVIRRPARIGGRRALVIDVNRLSLSRAQKIAAFDKTRVSDRRHVVDEKSGLEDVQLAREPGPSSATDGIRQYCDILHDLNNALVSILLNAQLIEWKLPSYSRIKRNIHEIERSAQRVGVLVRGLREFVDDKEAPEQPPVRAATESICIDSP